MSPVRVHICDDHARVREALRRLLEGTPDLVVSGESTNADEAVARVHSELPDVLLLDIAMPGRNGLDALADLRAASPATRIVVLSLHEDASYRRSAFAGGAQAYVVKEAAAELVPTIRGLMQTPQLDATRA